VTLIVGLRGADGVVLASDSQATREDLRQPTPKLFKADCGITWGTAGPLAGAQALYAEFEKLDLSRNPRREDAKAAIGAAMRTTAAGLVAPRRSAEQEWFEGLFAWFDAHDRRHYLLLARHDGHTEFMAPYGAVGSSRRLGLFGFSRSAFMNYETLQLETTKMLTYMVAEDAIKASAKGVDGPIQMAVLNTGTTAVLRDDELQPVKETVAAFQLHQRDFVKRVAAGRRTGTGLIPGNHEV
jgi:20S proteasome alpha/beta subunit